MNSLFPFIYASIVLVLLLQAFRVMWKGFQSSKTDASQPKSQGDRTGKITIHPELLDQEGRITDEELLTVRFSGDNEPPQSAENSPN